MNQFSPSLQLADRQIPDTLFTMTKNTNNSKARTLTRVLGFAAVAVVAVSILGCNATKGLGEDLQESSDNVKNAGKK